MLTCSCTVPQQKMNSGICLCVLLATLSASCLRRAYCSVQREGSTPTLSRHARSTATDAPATDGTRANTANTAAANLSELLTKLMARKASLRKLSSSKSKANGLSSNHQIKDRDYLGWMDFGRRGTEEYEYSS